MFLPLHRFSGEQHRQTVLLRAPKEKIEKSYNRRSSTRESRDALARESVAIHSVKYCPRNKSRQAEPSTFESTGTAPAKLKVREDKIKIVKDLKRYKNNGEFDPGSG